MKNFSKNRLRYSSEESVKNSSRYDLSKGALGGIPLFKGNSHEKFQKKSEKYFILQFLSILKENLSTNLKRHPFSGSEVYKSRYYYLKGIELATSWNSKSSWQVLFALSVNSIPSPSPLSSAVACNWQTLMG